MGQMRGRFAPSPTGDLHLGNLRTALVSWLQTKADAGEWLIRMEDLDRITSSAAHEASQIADLARLGMTSDAPVVRQSERFSIYRDAISTLQRMGRVYECYCSRREIREAASAPHDGPSDAGPDTYPGTCRSLGAARVAQLRESGRSPALRLRSENEAFEINDLIAGPFHGVSDDVVIQRNDGVPAYNLAVVVDDASQGVSHVTRGGDLITSVPRQRLLQQLLQLPEPTYAHVPLVLGPDGSRLAKRHGSTTLNELVEAGVSVDEILERLKKSLGMTDDKESIKSIKAIKAFDIRTIPKQQWVLTNVDLQHQPNPFPNDFPNDYPNDYPNGRDH